MLIWLNAFKQLLYKRPPTYYNMIIIKTYQLLHTFCDRRKNVNARQKQGLREDLHCISYQIFIYPCLMKYLNIITRLEMCFFALYVIDKKYLSNPSLLLYFFSVFLWWTHCKWVTVFCSAYAPLEVRED